MELENMQHIVDRFPEGSWKGLDIPDEWFPIIHKLDADLAEIDPDYILLQVKTKFGSLRYYTSHSHTIPTGGIVAIDKLVVGAEREVHKLEETTKG